MDKMPSPEPPPPPVGSRPPGSRSPVVAAVLGWILPGLGQIYTGRFGKGVLYFVAILGTFILGMVLTDFSAVDIQAHPLDFAAQVFAGGPTFVARELTRTHVLAALPRWIETGRLYVLVAGLLNLVAMTDAVGEAILRNRQALAWSEELRLRAVRAGEEEVEEDADAETEAGR